MTSDFRFIRERGVKFATPDEFEEVGRKAKEVRMKWQVCHPNL
jgi:hypothetical protein